MFRNHYERWLVLGFQIGGEVCGEVQKLLSPFNIMHPNLSFSLCVCCYFRLNPATFEALSATNPRHVVRAVLPRRTHWVSSEGGPVLQLWGEELQATGSRWYRLPWGRQAGHRRLHSVWSVAFPSHVHGVALWPLLRGERRGIAEAVMIRLVRGRQSVSGGHPRSSWVQELWSTSVL